MRYKLSDGQVHLVRGVLKTKGMYHKDLAVQLDIPSCTLSKYLTRTTDHREVLPPMCAAKMYAALDENPLLSFLNDYGEVGRETSMSNQGVILPLTYKGDYWCGIIDEYARTFKDLIGPKPNRTKLKIIGDLEGLVEKYKQED